MLIYLVFFVLAHVLLFLQSDNKVWAERVETLDEFARYGILVIMILRLLLEFLRDFKPKKGPNASLFVAA